MGEGWEVLQSGTSELPTEALIVVEPNPYSPDHVSERLGSLGMKRGYK